MPKTVPMTQTSPSFLPEAQAVQPSRMIHHDKVAVWSCGIALGTCICLSTLGTVVSLFPPGILLEPGTPYTCGIHAGCAGRWTPRYGLRCSDTLDQALYSGTGTGKVHNGHWQNCAMRSGKGKGKVQPIRGEGMGGRVRIVLNMLIA